MVWGDACPTSCPCHVNSMWKQPHHVVTWVQIHLTMQKHVLMDNLPKEGFLPHGHTCKFVHLIFTTLAFSTSCKSTWKHNMVQDHCCSSSRWKLVHFNHLLQLMMKKYINKSYWLAIIWFWLWIGISCNQKPLFGNQIYLLMHFLIMSCNEQVATHGWNEAVFLM